ncbi:two-component sensor histidine kinase [Sphaerisporangium siamense]|nr:two-component sensor histidine kinase [Sphaerisporangium siamense]
MVSGMNRPDRLLAALAGRPWALDALVAAVLFLATLGPGRVPDGPPWLLAFQAALVLPLVWRRRAPLTVFAVIAAVAGAQWLAGVQLPADVALLVALYTVGAHSSWRRTLAAWVVLEGGAVLASVRWAPEGRLLPSVAAMTAFTVAAAVIGTNMRTRRVYVAGLERDRDRRARLAVAEDRARMARDMHDIVTHNLSVMVALADSARYVRDSSPDKAATAMEQISATGRQALADMRRCLGVLRPDEPDAERHPMPGIAQLTALADQLRAAGLPTRVRLDGDADGIPATAQLTVYRLAQEALTNALKHTTPGTRAEVSLRMSPEGVTLEITDDGRPAPAPGHAPRHRPGDGPGHGIPGMRERVAAFGGTLRAGPLPGGGWRVVARLNLETARTGAP